MRYLRLILSFWLAIAVPTTAMASLVNADHCQRMQESQAMAGMDHAQHARHMQSAPDGSDKTSVQNPVQHADSGCTCGCNCFNAHCAAAFLGFMDGLLAQADFYDGPVVLASRTQPGHLASAHHLELLRPPTLS